MATIGISTNNFLKSPKFTGQVQLPDGSSLFPSLTFTNETGLSSGMYRLSNGTFGFSTSGVEALRIAPTLVTFSLPISSTGNITAPIFIGALQGNATSATTATNVSNLTSGQVTTALGFTPYNATNPSNYIDTPGARNAISVTGAGGSYSASTGVITITGAVSSVQGHTGAVVLNNSDIVGALGYTPYNFLVANNITIGNDIQQVWSGSFTDASPSKAALINLSETAASAQSTTALANRARMLQINTLAGSTAWGLAIGLKGQTNTLTLDQNGSLLHVGVPYSVSGVSGGRFSTITGAGGTTPGLASGSVTLATGASSGGGTGIVSISSGTDSSTGATGTMSLTTGNSAGGGTGSINITTGNDSGIGTTGNINITAGTSTAGANGAINFVTSGVTRLNIQPGGNVTGSLVFPIAMGGTGASTGPTALTALGAQPALGFTPYNATNPANYIDVPGARAAISVVGGGSYNASTGVITISGGGGGSVISVAGKTGTVTLVAADVSGVLAASNNLSDLTSVPSALTNLGLGTAATQNTGTSGATLPFMNGNNAWSGTQTFNSAPVMNTGLTFVGAATLGVTNNQTFSYENPITRFYVGDGTGYSFAFSKRVGSATTDLFTITDQGVATFNTRPTFNGRTPYDSGNLGIATSSNVGIVKPGVTMTIDGAGNLNTAIGPGTITYNPVIVATAGQTTFTVASGYSGNLIMVYVNGYKLPAADYTANNGTTIILNVAAAGGEEIETVVFSSQSLGATSTLIRTPFTATDNQTTFNVAYPLGMLLVSLRGDILPTSDYTAANGTTVVLNTGLAVGTQIEFIVFSASNLTNAINTTGGVMSGDLSLVTMNGGPLAGLRNFVINGGMRVAQRGTSYNLTSTVAYGSLDRWAAVQNGTYNAVLAQVAGTNGFQYFAKLGRPNAATSLGTISMYHVLETTNSIPLQGQTVTLSFYAKAGANFSASGSGMATVISTGTGTDQSAASFGTWAGVTTPINSTLTLTTTLTRYSYTLTIPTNVTQIGFQFAYNPSGTAGADDNLYITGVQLEISNTPTLFENRPYGLELSMCQRYYEQLTLSVASVGTTSVINLACNSVFAVPKRALPTIALITDNYQYTASGTTGVSTYQVKPQSVLAYRSTSGSAGQAQFSELVAAAAEL